MTGVPDPLEIHKLGWQWFQTHAQQRMQIVGFWFVAMSFLTTAAVLAYVNSRLGVCFCIQLGIVASSVLFLLFDLRTRELIGYGERLMAAVEDKIAEANGATEIAFVASMHASGRHTVSYRVLFTTLYGSAGAIGLTTAILTLIAM